MLVIDYQESIEPMNIEGTRTMSYKDGLVRLEVEEISQKKEAKELLKGFKSTDDVMVLLLKNNIYRLDIKPKDRVFIFGVEYFVSVVDKVVPKDFITLVNRTPSLYQRYAQIRMVVVRGR